MNRRGAACGPALAVLCFVLLAAPTLFTALPSQTPPPSDLRPHRDDVQDLGSLLAALPDAVSPAVALGPAADWLFPAGGIAPAPSSIPEVLDVVRRDVPWDPVPIPDAPAGEEPLLAALQTHAGTAGFDLPDLALLRAQVASLRLVPEAEDALARLVLAYDEAVRLEAEAVRDLTPDEVALLGRDPAAVAAWLADDPTRGADDFDALHRDLVARVDFSQRLRAADLLLRTIELVKDPLALPPAPLADLPGAADPDAPPAWPATGDADWDRVYALVGLGVDRDADRAAPVLPDRPHESLPQALAGLATTLGLPGAQLPLDGLERLPASLSDAVATIVTARRVGLESGDATTHTLLMLEATREARPTLEAWAAVLDLPDADLPDAAALLEVALSPDPLPSLLLSGRLGAPAAVPDPPALASLLEREGLPAAEALAAASALPAPVALGTAHALHGLQRFDARREQVLSGLDPSARDALGQAGTVAALLEAPTWSPDEAALVAAWARGMSSLGPDGLRALRQSQVDLLAAVEAAVAVLGPYAASAGAGVVDALPADAPEPAPKADQPWYRRVLSLLSSVPVVGTASAQLPPSPVQRPCTPLPSSQNVPALSDCDQDVWFRLEAQGRGILVTGFGATTVRPGVVDGNPDLVIDLGGGDTYRHPVGSAQGLGTARVAIDLGGNDLYDPLPARLAPGAADGIGSLGILWDAGGSDVHRHACAEDGLCTGAHGYGANGGVGVLLDGAGGDTYDAPDSRAHGVGWTGGTGLLLDLGDGRDRLHAGSGQGYGSGTGSLGLLLNDGDGDNRYVTSVGNPRFQGGHSAGSAAVGILVDLGGKGTFYQNLEVPEGPGYRSFETDPQLRQDDAVWAEATPNGGLGLGIDSTGPDRDDDGDGFPNPVELAAGSNPQDVNSRPGSPGDLQSQVENLLESIDTDDPGAVLGDFLPMRDSHLCDPESAQEWQCTALLHLGGTSDDVVSGPAHILIELGGDDSYPAEVAGPGGFWASGPVVRQGEETEDTDAEVAVVRYNGVGSFALDLSGNDDYLTPQDGGATQGAVDVFGLDPSNLLNTEGFTPTDLLSPVSLLLDLSGDDEYTAGQLSQGAAWSRDCLAMNNPGAAWLVDLDGDDTYTSDARSQGYVLVRAGRAGVLDLLGEDTYMFEKQAVAETKPSSQLSFTGIACASIRDAPSLALLFDGSGRDTYQSSVQLNTPPEEGDPADVQEVFSTQGVSYRSGDLGVFLDQGNDYDNYIMSLSPSGNVNSNFMKNNQTNEHFNTPNGEGAMPGTEYFMDSPAWFGNHEDPDSDGAPVVTEWLAGSDPDDPDDNLGAFWGSLGRLEALLADPPGATGHLGLEGDEPALRIPGRLVIDGRGDGVYHEAVPFFVSLGGNNVYDAPYVGGSRPDPSVPGVITVTPPSAVTLLLDVGSGDTAYAPDPQACVWTDPDELVVGHGCTSLGGASNGIAILADGGGTNTFHTVGSVDVETDGGHVLNLVTQGAAVGKSVGALVTWDATNEFLAEFTVRLEKSPTGDPIRLDLRGVAQGAGVEGLGLLASLGSNDDTYDVRLAAVETASGDPDPMIKSLAQGAAWTDEPAGSNSPLLARAPSYGILLDGGGANRFTAPSGYAQGFAYSRYAVPTTTAVPPLQTNIPTMGLLWSGTGDDLFEAQRYSQGSALEQGFNTLGLLYDAGGNDEYLILPTDDGSAFSQGSGSIGTGILVDVAGDDLYRSGSTHVQGVGAGGTGLLLDGGGHDQYQAAGSAQAYASDAATSNALLLDVHGHDRYRLDGGDGMGYSSSGCALFVDGGGRDEYFGHPDAGDDKNWLQAGGLCAAGVDANAVDAAALAAALSPGLLVGLEAFSGPSSLGDGDKTSGGVLLRALVNGAASDQDRIRRVSFLGNSEVLGHGKPVDGEEGEPLAYEFLWQTGSTEFPEAYPDGTYRVWASVFLDTGLDAGAAGGPDLPARDSSSMDIKIDNPPRVEATLDDLLVSPAQGQSVPLTVRLGRDLGWPGGVDGLALCGDLGIAPSDCHPGATVRLSRVAEDGTAFPVLDAYRPAGSHSFALTGLDGSTPWADGRYQLVVEAADAASNLRSVTLPDPLLVDSTPPTSSVAIPAFANEDHALGGGSSLRLAWDHSDGDGSGVQQVCVFQFPDEAGQPADDGQTLKCLGPAQTTLDVGDAQTGDVLHFLTTAVDRAGNLESPCLKGEAAKLAPGQLCHLHKAGEDGVQTLTIDFDRPTVAFGSLRVNGLEPKDAYVRPGAPVNFTVQVSDAGSGVGRVELRLPGSQGPVQMETVDGSHYWYDEWGDHNADLGTGREEPLIIALTVFDRAINRQPELQSATLDDRAPLVLVQGTEYVEVEAEAEKSLLAGRPGVYADVRARIADAALGSLTLDVGSLAGTESTLLPCSVEGPPADPGLKTCRVRIPPGTGDGDYRVWFNATDRAGNHNTTESALIEVRSQPLDLRDIRIASKGHDRFRVEWSTEFEGTSTVHYGLTGEFGQVASLEGHRTQHSVEVTGLAPSSTYVFQVVSENTAGIPSRSTAFTATTLNAYTFELAELPDAPLRGVVDVGYDVSFLDGDSPLQGTLKVQDAAGAASPFEVTTVEMAPGPGSLPFDTTRFADGDYRFVLDLDRAGDFRRVESPDFRIDNTEPVVLPVSPRPASTVAEVAPAFEAILLDSMGREPPVLASLRARVDGREVPIQVVSDEVAGASSLQRRVVFTLQQELEQGPHDVELTVSDRAGNVGRAEWPLGVDTLAPVLDGAAEATPLPGPDAARPGGRLHVTARLLDDAKVASARLDLAVLGGSAAPLLATDDHWETTIDVPVDAPHGTLQVPIVATDGLGNEGVAGRVEVTVDARPPRVLQTTATNVTHTSVDVDLGTDKPSLAWAGDGPVPATGTWRTEHRLHVGDLAPGEDHAIVLNVVDRAGYHVTQTLDVATLDDDQAPGAVGGLSASSPAEGVVVLAWTEASDNAGIRHYRVERDAAQGAPAMETNLTHNATAFRDERAPAGRTVTYRVTPVDVAGLEGPAVRLAVDVLALPHLRNATITPTRGPSDEPFMFQVEYRHAGNRAADSLTVRVGDEVHPLSRVDEADACHDGCLYRVRLRLPPSSLFGSAEEALFQASTAGQQGVLTVTDLPFVLRAGDDGVIDLSADGRAAPGPGLLALALLLATCASVLQRRSRP